MDLVSLVIVLIVVGVLLCLVNQIIPMDANIKTIINVLVVVVAVLWLVNILIGPIPLIRIGPIR